MKKLIQKILNFFTNKTNVNMENENSKEENNREEEVLDFDYHMMMGMNYRTKSQEYFENKEYKEILSLNMMAIVAFEQAQKMTTDPEMVATIQGNREIGVR